MCNLDRANYCPNNPYHDRAQNINYNVVISAPHIHGEVLELVRDKIKPGCKVLDIGFGSGYLTVALSKMMQDKGVVYGIEHIPQLFDFGKTNIMKKDGKLLEEGKIVLIQGDGRNGLPNHAPFDIIQVGAAAKELPQTLVEQLAPGGRLVIPLGPNQNNQHIWVVDKDKNGKINAHPTMGVCFVPLTSAKEQLSGGGN